MHRYLVSISYQADTGVGFASFELCRTQQLCSMDDVKRITDDLRDDGYDNAVVLGFSQFTNPAAR